MHERSSSIHLGAAPGHARAGLILVHGRGQTPAYMIEHVLDPLRGSMELGPVAVVLPSATGETWYPNRFVAPLSDNEPHLSSALSLLDQHVDELEGAGIPGERIVLVGFSQGACLVAEWLSRRGPRVGHVVVLTGGLIGPDGTNWMSGLSLTGVKVFLSGADQDPFVPAASVEMSAEVLADRGADVRCALRSSAEHEIVESEVDAVVTALKAALA